jgi:histidinol phosphatase-like PHP family hydrolase
MCGLHTLLEIVDIAANKGMRLVNISDHGSATGKKMNFWVIADKRRCPREINSSQGKAITVLAGIETNILDIDGNSDFPQGLVREFDLVSAGIHHPIGESADENAQALENYLSQYPLDILTHPCHARRPQNLEKVVALSLEYGFALEVNNTSLLLGKTNVKQLEKMINLARESGAPLVENSDGHSFHTIGENEAVERFLNELELDGDEIFINRDDQKLDAFLSRRKKLRE